MWLGPPQLKIKMTDFAFPVLFDPELNVVGSRYGTRLFPETWIIDPSGVVQLRMISKVTAEQLDTILQQYREQYTG